MEGNSRANLVTRFRRRLQSRAKTTSDETIKRRPQKLQKKTVHDSTENHDEGMNELGERTYSVFSEASTLVEERRSRDHTDMLHGLAHHDSFDSLVDASYNQSKGGSNPHIDEAQLRRIKARNEKSEGMIRRLSSDVWKHISSFLDPADAAHLAMSNKTLSWKLGPDSLRALALPEHRQHRIRFLRHMDGHFPNHLLCFPCGVYHRRTSIGNEKLKADFVNYPLYACPLVFASYLPRMRLAHGRELPYSFIQLAIRHSLHSKNHGNDPNLLSRRWKDSTNGWMHQSRYIIHDGRLLMRIRSQTFAPPKLTVTAQRHLLYEREDYQPYFSVCAHWRDGELMQLCKCALSHVPEPRQSYLTQLKKAPTVSRTLNHASLVARQCDECRPARRCPECPTEYLIEISMTEDRRDPVNRFKHMLSVTRWSDLGDGSSPTDNPEYCAINGIEAEYDSFSHVGRRAVAGILRHRTGNQKRLPPYINTVL
ncbi:hypothetical protein K491DRAFT_700717 [Lophiostoma macrostomum CBS 122681]|uniref:F-box domain-containing protein n=1 Tax=Lophiostoma macrostomum CBS 122681 TaxID=1314788 RepID=A0A6A6TPP2_9PLEO|nr:hypothetical protein K491DRAFT_700717 [Lophiostoma macrostomum CBS 122681]